MTKKKQVLCGLRSIFSLFNCQTPEKHRLGTAEAVARMAEDMEDGRENVLFKEKYRGCSGREFRKHLRQEIKQYRKYKKALKNARQQTADRGKS